MAVLQAQPNLLDMFKALHAGHQVSGSASSKGTVLLRSLFVCVQLHFTLARSFTHWLACRADMLMTSQLLLCLVAS